MQCDEAAREAFAPEIEQIALRRIEGVRVHAFRAQGLEHGVAAHERDLAFRRAAAQQHRDFSETRCRRHFSSPTIRTSGTRSASFFSSTILLTSRISHSMPAALAFPPGLTMKFESFSTPRAPPRDRPFSPQAPIRPPAGPSAA